MMMLPKYEELYFINRLTLPLVKKKGSDFNFRCIVCGDSKTNKHKKRGWFLDKKDADSYFYHCYNCNAHSPLKWFLKEQEPTLYAEYCAKERELNLNDGFSFVQKTQKKKRIDIFGDISYYDLSYPNFVPVKEHKDSVEYLKGRKIPYEVVKKLKWCTLEAKLPNGKDHPARDLIIFPFYDSDGRIYGYQGRARNIKRFHTETQDNLKVYNIFNVDYDKPVYIFESIIDSLYTPNSIAMVGGHLSKYIIDKLKTPIIVFDNDRNEEIYEKMERVIKDGHSLFIWPNHIKEKDINQLIVQGWTEFDVNKLIEGNVFSGTEANVKLNFKRMRKTRN